MNSKEEMRTKGAKVSGKGEIRTRKLRWEQLGMEDGHGRWARVSGVT